MMKARIATCKRHTVGRGRKRIGEMTTVQVGGWRAGSEIRWDAGTAVVKGWEATIQIRIGNVNRWWNVGHYSARFWHHAMCTARDKLSVPVREAVRRELGRPRDRVSRLLSDDQTGTTTSGPLPRKASTTGKLPSVVVSTPLTQWNQALRLAYWCTTLRNRSSTL